jgi:hypothetical protein
MRSRLLASTGALALTLGGLLVSAGPAAAATDPAHCYGWSHGNYYSGGGIHFLAGGTKIRRGPYTDCDAFGAGYAGQGINVECSVENSTSTYWLYVVDTTTGVAGWSAWSALDHPGISLSNIPGCPEP